MPRACSPPLNTSQNARRKPPTETDTRSRKSASRDWTEAYALFNLGKRLTKAGQRLPDFTGPDWVARDYMTAKAWQLVDEMQKRGQLRAALARYERETALRE